MTETNFRTFQHCKSQTGFPLTWKTWKTPGIFLTWKILRRLLEFSVRLEFLEW